MEPLSTILAFSGNDPLPDLQNFYRNGELCLGTHYGEEKRFILKLTTCTFGCATYGTSINDSALSVNDPLLDLQKIFRNV